MGAFMSRGLRLLFRHRLGPFFLALILLLIGITIGLTSHQVTYQRIEHVKILHYLSGSGANQTDLLHYLSGSGESKAYIQLQDHSLYVLKLSEFTPALNADSLQSPISTLIYEPQDTEEIDASASNTGTHLAGNGAKVVQLISYGADGSKKTFSSREYIQNPQGFYRNNWSIGGYFLGAGLLLGLVLFLFARHRISGSTETMPVPTVYATPKPATTTTQPFPSQPSTFYPPTPLPQQGPISQMGFQNYHQQPLPPQTVAPQMAFQDYYQHPTTPQTIAPHIFFQQQQIDFPQTVSEVQQLDFPQLDFPQNP